MKNLVINSLLGVEVSGFLGPLASSFSELSLKRAKESTWPVPLLTLQSASQKEKRLGDGESRGLLLRLSGLSPEKDGWLAAAGLYSRMPREASQEKVATVRESVVIGTASSKSCPWEPHSMRPFCVLTALTMSSNEWAARFCWECFVLCSLLDKCV